MDAQHYVFRLTLLTGESNEIQGEAAVTLRLVTAGVREVFLDFTTLGASGKGMTVASVTSAGQPVTCTSKSDTGGVVVIPAHSHGTALKSRRPGSH